MKSKLISDRFLLGILYAIIATAILVAAILAEPSKTPHKPRVFLGGQEIVVDIADTPASQEHGLSGHEALGESEGMLFIFPAPTAQGFWMKDMRFPIDIIYFDQNHRVVDVWEGASPSSYPKIFTPSVPAQFVLEVQAGFFAEHHLKVGNMFELVR